jgi:hypothetical protein
MRNGSGVESGYCQEAHSDSSFGESELRYGVGVGVMSV